MKRTLPLALVALLAACGGPEVRIAVPPAEAPERVGIGFSSIEVRDITLPTYAQSESIFVEEADGTLVGSDDLLWADDPQRAATLELSRALAEITDVPVAPEPWPFEPYPAARVEVRVEEFVASRSGAFRLAGQYFVAALDGSGRDRARLFRLSVPLAVDAGPGQIAAARGQAMAALADRIARDGLR
ncbi:PqiC family protein [Wenxinia marina]|uniref:ABC-type transport auxiliary lipoprotein component domain-containing protein n=1 Tax=Wenxinia marina DSM 24838 TaxID=1123501 RepID=A0A0D0PBP5_9RHOB|nr:ABC-type transport auxiliary lipoprotein family protein [Wenxinia marina]KIQ68876.1 hypothetical protein Wenmar_02605 [Wenxinia marina DSM 24838]GGL64495.1 lipoprotein [Wenxinia marina]